MKGILVGVGISLPIWAILWLMVGSSRMWQVIDSLFIVAAGLIIAGAIHNWGK